MSEEFIALTERFPEAALTPAGRLIPPTSSREPALRLSIGCECLDRDYWVWQKALPALRELSP